MSQRISIAVNTRFLIKDKLEGIGLFTYESLKHITQTHPDIDYYFLFDRKYDPSFIFGDNVKPVVLFPPARHPFLWYWWFEISVKNWLQKNKPALFLSPENFGCLQTDIPQVIAIHDLAYEHFKEYFQPLHYAYYKYFLPKYAHKAKRIATVSEFSKKDIVEQYQIDPSKIDVVYNGAKEVYTPVSNAIKQHVKRKYTGGKCYFIYVGSIHPRKNVTRLLLAFDQFKQQTGSDLQLLIVGRMAWDFSEVQQTHRGMKAKDSVHFTGYVAPDEIGNVTASATAMVYVSLFEGFGIPIIEAMRCEVPVITSNTTSMPEAAGDAALLVNPLSVEDICAAMKKIAGDDNLRVALIEKGKTQIEKFSWQLTGEKLWACCEKALQL